MGWKKWKVTLLWCVCLLEPPLAALPALYVCHSPPPHAPPCTPLRLLTFPQSSSGDATKDTEKELALVQKRVQDISYSPGKQLFQMGLMLWMSGSGIHIFSIMMTFMAMMSPVRGIMNMQATFKQFEGMEKVDLAMPKIIFVGLNLVGLSMGMYKLAVMGLLPLTAADWYQLVENRVNRTA